MGDFCETLLTVQGLMSTIVRLKNVNNNSQDGSCCELSGCHAMKPGDADNGQSKLEQDYEDIQKGLNENGPTDAVNVNMATGEYNEQDLSAALSDECSSSNSTGNLSLSNEEYDDYDDDDEVIFPANQQYPEDDISEQSDDCVYAYRGADFDVIEHRNNNNVDDETDFLEMDFEPDPASEIDNTANDSHIGRSNFSTDGLADDSLLPIQMLDEQSNAQNVRHISSCNSNHLQAATSAGLWCAPHSNQNNISAEMGGEESASKFKFTGAKPKKQLVEKLGPPKVSSPRKQLPIETKALDIVTKCSPYTNGVTVPIEHDDSCIDCLENEFLSTTIGRKLETSFCRKCRRRTPRNGLENRSVGIDGDFSFDGTRLSQKMDGLDMSDSLVEKVTSNHNVDNLLLKRTGKESVTFSSVNVDEKIVIQALDHINVSFDKDMIKEHFENLNTFRPHFDDVTELILYTSKKNCDYKQVIKLIKLACKDEVDIKFTKDENVSKETEIVQVRSTEIIEIWAIQQQNLERLKCLNKKFIQMNVLGKVINVIRHAQQQQRNTKSLEEFIVVPQYYKTGYICITKK